MTPVHVINAAAEAAGGRVRPSTVKQIADAAHRAGRLRTYRALMGELLPGDVAIYPGTDRAVEISLIVDHPGHVEVHWVDSKENPPTEHAPDGVLPVLPEVTPVTCICTRPQPEPEQTTCTCTRPQPNGLGECRSCLRLVLTHSWHAGRPGPDLDGAA